MFVGFGIVDDVNYWYLGYVRCLGMKCCGNDRVVGVVVSMLNFLCLLVSVVFNVMCILVIVCEMVCLKVLLCSRKVISSDISMLLVLVMFIGRCGEV